VADGRPRTAARVRSAATEPASTATGAVVRRRMQAQKSRDTQPELALRRHLHAAGLRYRVDRAPLPGLRRRADVVFGPARVAVYLDGCFWHSCPDHGTQPRSNAAWWAEKLRRNRERDAQTDDALRAAGWVPLRFWEHDDPAAAAQVVAAAVSCRRPAGRAPGPGRTGAEGR
jgi:DNA mismatch endonuclease (patch repair protein)